MNTFLSLLSIECMKIYKRPGAYTFLATLLLLNIILGIFVNQVFTVNAAIPFWEYMNVSSRLLILVQLISIVYAGDILSTEYTKGTIKLLLIRPFSRSKILLSKLVTIFLLVGILTISQFVFAFLTSLVLFTTGISAIDTIFLDAVSYYFFIFIEMIVVCILAFTLSVITKSNVFSITITIFIFYASSVLVALMEHYDLEKAKFLLFANTNLQQYYYGKPMFSGMSLTFSIIIILLHVAMLLVVSFGVFKKRGIHT